MIPAPMAPTTIMANLLRLILSNTLQPSNAATKVIVKGKFQLLKKAGLVLTGFDRKTCVMTGKANPQKQTRKMRINDQYARELDKE